MRSPGMALVWELLHRHRWGLLAIAGYLLAMVAVSLELLPGVDLMASLGLVDARGEIVVERFVAGVMLPLTAAAIYVIGMFSFGFTGDLTARQSMFPARLFTLPVTTAELVAWPMFLGAAAMAFLWLLPAALLGDAPGLDMPRIWPAFFAAAFVAWTQVLTWLPYPATGLRVIAALAFLIGIDAVIVVAIELELPEAVMVAVFAPQLPIAYVAARAAVTRARQGLGTDRPEALERLGSREALWSAPRPPFSSPARAQWWYEWRHHGWVLPTWVGVVLPFELGLLFLAGRTHVFVLLTLIAVLCTPPLLASFVAASVRSTSPRDREAGSLPTFLSTRPMTSAALVAAKLGVATWSTAATWLLVLVAVPVALGLSGTWEIMLDVAGRVRSAVGLPRTVVVCLLGLSLLVVATWRRLVSSLYVGLSGRAWLARASMGMSLALLGAALPLAQWMDRSAGVRAGIWAAIPWVAAGLVALKMAAAGWLAARLVETRLLSDRTLIVGAASWVAAVLTLYAVLAWIVATPHMPHYLLVLVSILVVPLVRLSAAPLALARNRHR